jgi:serine phosphatase RsbU (regulator of sigma subunit)/HAMP domain-containing protein
MEDGARANGAYADIQPAESISWRVMSVKDTALDIIETVRTVVPYLLVLVVGGGVAVVVAWAASYRIVRPLRELERTARNAALGAYVKPIAESGDDEIGRVAKAFNEVALRLNSLHALSQLLASTSSLDQVLDGILAAVGHIVGPGTSAIYLLNTAERRLDPVRVRGAGLAGAQPVGLGDAVWLMEVLGGSEPEVLTGDSAVMQAELPGIEGSYRSALAAPLVAGNEVLGLVVILKDGNERVSEAEREMVRTFSAQASVAVQTSRLFEIETASRKVADALRVVAQELVRPEELEDSLAKVEDVVSELFSSSRTRVLIVNRESLGLESAQDPDVEVETLDNAKAIFDEHGGSAVLLRRGQCPSADALMGESAAALLAVPIGLDGDHGGASVVDLPVEGGREDAVEVGRALGDEVSLALDNAYLYQRALLRAANLETIFRISQAVGSSLQVNVVLNRVLDVVQKILAADAVMLWSYDSRRRSLGTAMVRGAVPAGLLHLELAPGEDLPGSIFDSGEPLVLRGLTTSMDGVAGSAAVQGMGSLLGVPLLARGRSIGVLMVLSTSDDSFSDESMNILQTFASQAALAIDTARLYSNEHEVAHILQHAILPEALPDFAEVEGGSVYAPAGGAAEIGGDYYDLFKARDGLVWFTIADVCGKGVEAATKTSMIKYAVRAFVAAGLSPGRVLGEVNAMVSEAGLPSDIVTLWVGAYDAKKGKVSWANGGHPPGVLRRADGEVERLGVTGPLLGVSADVDYDEQTLRIGRGDRILLFTDGVTEARSGNTFFGDERVELSLGLEGSAQEVAERLLAEVRGFVRAELKDDVAILVIAVRGSAKISGRGKARG